MREHTGFLAWIMEHQLPIILTETGKKAVESYWEGESSQTWWINAIHRTGTIDICSARHVEWLNVSPEMLDIDKMKNTKLSKIGGLP